MLRRLLPFLFLLASLRAPSAYGAPVVPSVTAPEAIVVDGWTGNVLFAKSPDVVRAPASTVKVMTALIVLRHHLPLKRAFTVSNVAASYGGSTAGLYAGEQMTGWNLLHGMLMVSGNDAAIALSEALAGSPSRFVDLMNAEALRLRLYHTHYLSPNGYDMWGQVTTARDLANLARAAMNVPTFARIVRTRYWTAWSADHRIVHRWANLNKLLWLSHVVDGIKTGTTPYAGACLVSSARSEGKWVIAVNLGSAAGSRFSDGAALLNYGLQSESSPPSTR
jgi:serine-type D-Ala-D-Ala carboxypeptidase (penicillin-binding protein 5/6)